VFVAAAVATFAVLGSVVAAAGGSLSIGAAVGQRLAGGGLIVLSILSVVANRGWWAPTWRPVATLPGRPVARAALLGVGCGASWSPCVGPLLGAALTAAGGTGSVPRGAMLLASFGLGITSPFVLLATLPLPRAPRWARGVGRAVTTVMPAVLVAFGVVLLAGWYDVVVRSLPVSAG
jgi:cytochrome c-type biogenesis protein